jgi:hypothetical protein
VQPLTPEQLSNLDRVLTPEEQKIVDAWQAKQAAGMQAAEESKGGPKAAITVTPKGALVKAFKGEPSPEVPAWLPWVPRAVGIGGAGATLMLLLKRRWGWSFATLFLLTPAAAVIATMGAIVVAAKQIKSKQA